MRQLVHIACNLMSERWWWLPVAITETPPNGTGFSWLRRNTKSVTANISAGIRPISSMNMIFMRKSDCSCFTGERARLVRACSAERMPKSTTERMPKSTTKRVPKSTTGMVIMRCGCSPPRVLAIPRWTLRAACCTLVAWRYLVGWAADEFCQGLAVRWRERTV